MDNPVKMAISGDKQAFIEIIGRNADMLYRIALSYLKNRDEAQEAVQEVTFRAYRNIKSLKSEEFFDTWLVRILINYCNNELKRRSKTILSLDFLPADIWDKAQEIEDEHERFEFIKAELNKLGDDYSDDEIEDFINKYKMN